MTDDTSETPKKDRRLFVTVLGGFLFCLGACALLGVYAYVSGSLDRLPGLPWQSTPDTAELAIQATQLMDAGQYDQASQLWTRVIQSNPNDHDAYYSRAVCYYNLTPHEHLLGIYRAYLTSALADMDTAIALQPDNGDYYSFRHEVLSSLAGTYEYRVDRQALILIAHEDIKAALALGYSYDYRFSDRVYAADLFALDQCDEGLPETMQMLEATAPDDPSISGLQNMQAQGAACLGRMDEAVQAVSASLEQTRYTEERSYTKAAYLYQLGRLDEALAVINQNIQAVPTFTGYRYYIRALIEYDMGRKDLAAADLQTGSQYTWERGSLYAYVSGKLALDAGRRDEGIRELRYAEATMDYNLSILHTRLLHELADLGVTPLVMLPSIPITSTPIPILQP